MCAKNVDLDKNSKFNLHISIKNTIFAAESRVGKVLNTHISRTKKVS